MNRKEGRVARSARLTGVAWKLLRTDRTMLALAAFSAVFTVAAMAVIFGFGTSWGDGRPTRGSMLVITLIAAWPLTFVGAFLNVALAAAADARLRGERLSLGAALAVSTSRVGQIALWSLLAAGVGQLISQIAERLPFGGRVATWVIGGAWALLTFFAIPVLALEGCTATGCVKRSATLMRKRWGEGAAGSIGIFAVFTLASIVPALLVGAGGAVAVFQPGIGIALIVAGAVGLLVIFAASSAVRQIFAVALYRYAVDGEVTGGFPAADLERPFTARKHRFGR
jgi:hypothetical protein